MINKYFYIGANPTVDLILTNHKNEVLLIKRAENVEACPNMWALPGGFIDSKSKKGDIWQEDLETSDEAALRELKEETNLDIKCQPVFLNIYEGNNRDPRDNNISHSKSYVYYYKLTENEFNNLNEMKTQENETSKVEWISLGNIKNIKMAFDHNLIINDYLKLTNKLKP